MAVRPIDGKWEKQRGGVVRCSYCDKGYRITKGGANVLTFAFCPNCGTRMDGKAEPIRHRWLLKDDGEGLRCVCSHCGKESKEETPFCAQCGAVMDGGKEK